MPAPDTHVELAVVGAGPAGLAAAAVAAEAGVGVLLIEERGWAGGRLGLQVQPLQGPRSIYLGLNGMEFCRGLLDEAASAGVEVMLHTKVASLGAETCLEPRTGLLRRRAFNLTLDRRATSAPGPQSKTRLLATHVIVASGSWEPRVEFQGSTLPGVILSGDAQVMVNVRSRLPGHRVVMVGSDNAGLLIAADLLAAGAEVVAVVEESPEILGREVNAAPLRETGVPILTSTKVVEARGGEAVESLTVADVDQSGTIVRGTERSLDVDAVCLAGPRIPAAELASEAGCPTLEVEIMGGPVPVHSRRMATPVPGLYVCGDVAGVENGAVSLESGRLAGLAATDDMGYRHPQAESHQSLARARLGYLRRGRRGLLRRKAKAALASVAHDPTG